jgi:Na+/H+-dicarboxylate symporter
MGKMSISPAEEGEASNLNNLIAFNKRSAIFKTIKKQMRENLLLIATVIGVFIGIGLAFIIRPYGLTKVERSYFGFPGELFLRMLKFLILPLIGSSLITGIAGLGTSKAGKVAGRALIYYFFTTVIAVIMGLVLVTTIQPGKNNKAGDNGEDFVDPLKGEKVTTVDTILDLIRQIIKNL